VSDTIDAARKTIEDRISTLRGELSQLESAAAALGGKAIGRARSAGRTRGPGRPRKRSAGGTGRRGRPRGSGARAAQAEKLVRDNPGISIAELAKKMNIKPNYLYRVLPQLQKDGKVRKRDKGWHPA
jgi:winged helix-turn-helix DNA-binding protein